MITWIRKIIGSIRSFGGLTGAFWILGQTIRNQGLAKTVQLVARTFALGPDGGSSIRSLEDKEKAVLEEAISDARAFVSKDFLRLGKPFKASFNHKWGEAAATLHRIVESIGQEKFDCMILLENVNFGGSSVYSLNLASALSKDQLGLKTIIIDTGKVNRPGSVTLPLGAKVVCMLEFGGVKEKDYEKILYALIGTIRPKLLFIGNSRAGWDLYVRRAES